ncbi:MAG: hypothetical protein WCC48_08995 [Anaeromyxobacteraceae bacterium]
MQSVHRSGLRAAAVALLLLGTAIAQEPQGAGGQPPAGASPPAPRGDTEQPAGEHGETKPGEQPTAAEQSPSSEGTTWVDDLHRRIERKLTDLTEDLDRVFGEDRRLDLEQPGTYLRWRSELRADEHGELSPRTSVRATLQLPALKRWGKRLQLAFSGESSGDPTIRRLEDPGDPGFSPSIRAEQANLELRNDFFRTPATVVQAATGVRLRLPFEYFGALRFRQRLDLGWKVTMRFTQQGSWTSREAFGEKTQVDLDRPVAAHTQVRWNNAGFVTEKSRGYEWATELGLAHQLEPLRTATYLAFALAGYRPPHEKAEVQLYRLFTRVRRDAWRRWLFVELEPEIGWPTTPPLGRHRVLAVTLRLDVILDGRSPQGNAASARPAPRASLNPAPGSPAPPR